MSLQQAECVDFCGVSFVLIKSHVFEILILRMLWSTESSLLNRVRFCIVGH